MAIVFNSLFGSNQSKTAGTSLAINPADITVATGDDIFVAYAGDDVGSAFGITDGGTASITWTQEKEQINAGNVKSQLWRGAVTGGGTLTDLTISWTTNVTAKAAVAGWFSGVGTQDGTDGTNASATEVVVMRHVVVAAQTDDLIVGVGGWEGPNGDSLSLFSSGYDLSSSAEVGQNGTTTGGDAGNISANLIYGILSANSGGNAEFRSSDNNSRDAAGAGAVYSPAAAAPSLIWQPAKPTRYKV